MHIVEPKANFRKTPPKRRAYRHKLIIAVVFILLLTLAVKATLWREKSAAPANEVGASVVEKVTVQEKSSTPEIRQFTGQEFKQLFESFVYPNVSEITTPFAITGNLAADDIIRAIAEGRGYRERAIPNTSLISVDGHLLQQKAVEPWDNMQKAAAADRIDLDLVSGFRPVDEQRQIFLQRLYATGTTASQIASGGGKDKINSILITTAIPGYSRHHTGFTIDLMCNGNEFAIFELTSCFRWLSADNYKNAKTHGWIPSYPPGAGQQGPEPETWEYVWVGTGATHN